jgi:thymidylate kinase
VRACAPGGGCLPWEDAGRSGSLIRFAFPSSSWGRGLTGVLPASADTDSAERPAVPLALVAKLSEALAAEGIVYCHWKSNDALDRAVRGDSDLDLLVRRRDAERFIAVIRGLGFKDARSPSIKRVPGVFHSYGLDEPSGRLVHIHAHYQLVLGDDTTKNYRLPIEDAYLDSADPNGVLPLPVPAPDFELVVFVVRMVLKHSTWDAIASDHGRLSISEARELDHLMNQADPERARSIVREYLPFIGDALWSRSRRCIEGRATVWFRVRTAHRLERALGPYARRRHGADSVLRLWRRGRIVIRRHVLHRPSPRGRLDGGGALIAVVGGDGAGKSTVVDELQRWLSEAFATTTVHLGKPPSSLTSSAVRRVWRRGVRGHMREPKVSGAYLAASDGTSMSRRASARLVGQVTTARDRYLTYRGARRFASGGWIVISDRFPLPEIELMDGPLARRMLDTPGGSPLVTSLARLESKYYERILDPDILVVLSVDPDLAVERKRGIDVEAVVRSRCEEIRDLDWDRLRAVVVDASRSKEDVLAEIKSAIWSRL